MSIQELKPYKKGKYNVVEVCKFEFVKIGKI